MQDKGRSQSHDPRIGPVRGGHWGRGGQGPTPDPTGSPLGGAFVAVSSGHLEGGAWRPASVLWAGQMNPLSPVPGACPLYPSSRLHQAPLVAPLPPENPPGRPMLLRSVTRVRLSAPPLVPPNLHLFSGSGSQLTQPSEQVADNHWDTGAIGLF